MFIFLKVLKRGCVFSSLVIVFIPFSHYVPQYLLFFLQQNIINIIVLR